MRYLVSDQKGVSLLISADRVMMHSEGTVLRWLLLVFFWLRWDLQRPMVGGRRRPCAALRAWRLPKEASFPKTRTTLCCAKGFRLLSVRRTKLPWRRVSNL
jgi:hypothetical protein